MEINPLGLSIPEVAHHRVALNGTELHYVCAGNDGPPVVLVHGFPETWWAFNKVIPALAKHHRVYAVDLRGFGDSGPATPEDNAQVLAEDLHSLISHLAVGPVHLVVQDISGQLGFWLAQSHPQDLLSIAAIETGLPGFGLEVLADVARGGAWYIGVLATPGTADAFFRGRETALIGDFIFPSLTAGRNAVAAEDIEEFARGYSRDGGWSGPRALYASAISDGPAIARRAKSSPLALPTLAIDRGGSTFTHDSFSAVHANRIKAANIEGVGHYVVMEAPLRTADTLANFFGGVASIC
jgi:pimeloyl-ACP methyl ester carboxylesterase